MSPSTPSVIEHDFSTTFNSYNPAVASVYLCYPCIILAGVKTNRKLLKQLRLVAGELFEQQQVHLNSIQDRLSDKASWTKACLSMACYPEFFPTEAVIGVRVEEDLGSPLLLLCDAFAKALLRRCPDGSKALRDEAQFLEDPHLAEGHHIHCKSQMIRLCNGALVLEDL